MNKKYAYATALVIRNTMVMGNGDIRNTIIVGYVGMEW